MAPALAEPDASVLLTIDSPLLVLAGAAAVLLYAAGVRARRQRGAPWPAARSVAFALGLVATLAGLASGIARYDDATFSLHMVQHLLVGMLGPMLLAASGIVTLALQTAPPSVRRPLRYLVHSPTCRRLTHPGVGFVAFASALALSLWTPVAAAAIDHDLVHAWLHLHLLLAGALFWWPVVGVDRSLRASPPSALLALVAMIPLHGFVAMSLLTATTPVGGATFLAVPRAWPFDPMHDLRVGAAVLWIGGELVTVAAGILVGRRWLAADRRNAVRLDRRLRAASGAM